MAPTEICVKHTYGQWQLCSTPLTYFKAVFCSLNSTIFSNVGKILSLPKSKGSPLRVNNMKNCPIHEYDGLIEAP